MNREPFRYMGPVRAALAICALACMIPFVVFGIALGIVICGIIVGYNIYRDFVEYPLEGRNKL